MSSSIASFFASFVSNADADESQKTAAADAEVNAEDSPKEEQTEDKEEETPQKEEEEEEEPEDVHPAIREECKQTTKCAPVTKHFEHCQEKVGAGEGFKGEDCVEELFHMMHCVDLRFVLVMPSSVIPSSAHLRFKPTFAAGASAHLRCVPALHFLQCAGDKLWTKLR